MCFYTVLLCQSTLFLSLTGLEVENYVTMSGNTPLDPPAHVQLLGAGVKNPPYSLFHVRILILYHYHYATSVTYAVQKTFIMTCRRLSSRLSLVLTPDKDRCMFASYYQERGTRPEARIILFLDSCSSIAPYLLPFELLS